jgi:hypothetical protein
MQTLQGPHLSTWQHAALPGASRGQNPQFITSVVTVLQLEYYAPGDIVVRQGDMGDAMYFLAQGSLEVRRATAWGSEQQGQNKKGPGGPGRLSPDCQTDHFQVDKPVPAANKQGVAVGSKMPLGQLCSVS